MDECKIKNSNTQCFYPPLLNVVFTNVAYCTPSYNIIIDGKSLMKPKHVSPDDLRRKLIEQITKLLFGNITKTSTQSDRLVNIFIYLASHETQRPSSPRSRNRLNQASSLLSFFRQANRRRPSPHHNPRHHPRSTQKHHQSRQSPRNNTRNLFRIQRRPAFDFKPVRDGNAAVPSRVRHAPIRENAPVEEERVLSGEFRQKTGFQMDFLE